MKHGEAVAAFEAAFAEYCGARYCIAASNGTVTLQAALIALGVKPGDRVAVPPLTMSATSIAVLNVGAVPVFCDVDPETWLMKVPTEPDLWRMPVSLYGLCVPWGGDTRMVDDAAQTLRQHSGAALTSYSFQASKILALGEGGMLVTNDEGLAEAARSYLSLGYRMSATQARIDSQALRSPTFARHHRYPAINGRMNDLTAAEGLRQVEAGTTGFRWVDERLAERKRCAALYAQAIAGCDWLTPQHVPEGWTHDYWAYAVAIGDVMTSDGGGWTAVMDRALAPDLRWQLFADAIVRHGGERPYAAWRLTYQEPAFGYLVSGWLADPTQMSGQPYPAQAGGLCPVAESLQPRLMQFQTNNLARAERNAEALRRAIREIGGSGSV